MFIPALAAAVLAVTLPSESYARAATSTEQIDEKIAYAIGMEAVFYGMGPVLMRLALESQSNADKPYDNAQASTNQMGQMGQGRRVPINEEAEALPVARKSQLRPIAGEPTRQRCANCSHALI
jgi:hypothetical protein